MEDKERKDLLDVIELAMTYRMALKHGDVGAELLGSILDTKAAVAINDYAPNTDIDRILKAFNRAIKRRESWIT